MNDDELDRLVATQGLDALLRELVEIFNLEGVELVRLSGLHRHAVGLGARITPEQLERTVAKFRAAGLIAWRYALHCPHCGELSWQVVPREDLRAAKLCDTCGQLYIPEPGRTLTDVDPALAARSGWPAC